jgi:predicted GH43/DUF377 family glycosyl hydrolase
MALPPLPVAPGRGDLGAGFCLVLRKVFSRGKKSSSNCLMMRFCVLAACIAACAAVPCVFTAKVDSFGPKPVISFVDGSSAFAQAFNPSWVVAGKNQKTAGMMIRTQDCASDPKQSGTCGNTYDPSKDPNKGCCHCAGTGKKSSILTFAALKGSDDSTVNEPTFEKIDNSSVVFGPHDNSDLRGTEDPRIAYNPQDEVYYMMYTCWAKNGTGQLCLATTKDPTSSSGWTRHGPAFSGDHKSGAILIRESGPHYLISGAGQIHISSTTDLTNFTLGPKFITKTAFGNPKVEAGPPPMKMADGNYVFFYNSWYVYSKLYSQSI